jgi:hypothetical protein
MIQMIQQYSTLIRDNACHRPAQSSSPKLILLENHLHQEHAQAEHKQPDNTAEQQESNMQGSTAEHSLPTTD